MYLSRNTRNVFAPILHADTKLSYGRIRPRESAIRSAIEHPDSIRRQRRENATHYSPTRIRNTRTCIETLQSSNPKLFSVASRNHKPKRKDFSRRADRRRRYRSIFPLSMEHLRRTIPRREAAAAIISRFWKLSNSFNQSPRMLSQERLHVQWSF